MKKTADFPVSVGSLLLMGGAVLVMAVIALTMLMGSRSETRVSKATEQAVTDYYRADAVAQGVLAQLREGEVPSGVQDEGDGVYAYTCPVSDTQQLEVRVRITGGEYEILRWQTGSAGVRQDAQPLQVWEGNGT